jgi:hypothetical protein
MSTRTIMPSLVQRRRHVFIGDHRWMVKYVTEPDNLGGVSASLVDAQGRERWESMLDVVRIEV